jgi:hypothetical protein
MAGADRTAQQWDMLWQITVIVSAKLAKALCKRSQTVI